MSKSHLSSPEAEVRRNRFLIICGCLALVILLLTAYLLTVLVCKVVIGWLKLYMLVVVMAV